MKRKLNRNYFSPYETFASRKLKIYTLLGKPVGLLPKFIQTRLESIDALLFPYERQIQKVLSVRRMDTKSSEAIYMYPFGRHLTQLLGGLQPLLDISKELQDIVTRYKSINGRHSHLVRDLLLPVRAVGNIIAGGLTIVATIPVTLTLIVNTLAVFILQCAELNFTDAIFKLIDDLIDCSIMPVSHMLNGVTRISLGLTQASKSVILPAILGFRGIHTLIRGKPKANEDQGVQEVCEDLKKLANKNKLDILSNGRKRSEIIVRISTNLCMIRLGKKLDNIKLQSRELQTIPGNKEGSLLLKNFMNQENKLRFMEFFESHCKEKSMADEIVTVAKAIAPAA